MNPQCMGEAETTEGGAELFGAKAKVGEDSYASVTDKLDELLLAGEPDDRARVELSQAPGFPCSRTFSHSQCSLLLC